MVLYTKTSLSDTLVASFSKWKLWARNKWDNDHKRNFFLLWRVLNTSSFFLHFAGLKWRSSIWLLFNFNQMVLSPHPYSWSYLLSTWMVFLYLNGTSDLWCPVSQRWRQADYRVLFRSLCCFIYSHVVSIESVSCPSGALHVKCGLYSRSKSVILKEDKINRWAIILSCHI